MPLCISSWKSLFGDLQHDDSFRKNESTDHMRTTPCLVWASVQLRPQGALNMDEAQFYSKKNLSTVKSTTLTFFVWTQMFPTLCLRQQHSWSCRKWSFSCRNTTQLVSTGQKWKGTVWLFTPDSSQWEDMNIVYIPTITVSDTTLKRNQSRSVERQTVWYWQMMGERLSFLSCWHVVTHTLQVTW